jgi:hypothetical protein
MEKVVSVDKILVEAVSRPEAQLPDGSWNPRYMMRLESSLYQLINWDMPHIFTRFKLDRELFWLRRRKTVGNMTFTDKGTCIGHEPKWHVKVRRKNAKKTQEARKRKKDRDAEAKGERMPDATKQNRTRSHPRRLKRTLRQR